MGRPFHEVEAEMVELVADATGLKVKDALLGVMPHFPRRQLYLSAGVNPFAFAELFYDPEVRMFSPVMPGDEVDEEGDELPPWYDHTLVLYAPTVGCIQIVEVDPGAAPKEHLRCDVVSEVGPDRKYRVRFKNLGGIQILNPGKKV